MKGMLEPQKMLHLFLQCILFLLYIQNSMQSSTPATGAEDLISARCQSKCLFELELRHKNNSEARRLLRHQISTLCKEDVQCASCILPCRELLLESDICAQNLCQDVLEPTQCKHSCNFLAQIAAQKPGQCPKQQLKPNGLETIEKCCQLGCSRTCMAPELNDNRFLPKPEGITVQERKRKRSAILRWIMKRMTPQHTTTNSNLFVIQWRWSVHKQPETMTPWQTVMVRNKMYAILKHLLVPGRFYIFRVAAVNMHGTYGFSQPSHPPFKLSKEVKAPSAPVNLTFSWEEPEDGVKIVWTPPESELPLKEYRLSWWKTSPEMANAFELRQRRGTKGTAGLDEDYDGGAAEIADIDDDEIRRQSRNLPGYTTKAELGGLDPYQHYVVELFATVDSSEGELRGEPAFLMLKGEKPKKEEALTTSTKASIDDMDFADDDQLQNEAGGFIAELKTPFFEAGRLKTIISWLDHPSCNQERVDGQKPPYRVLVRSIRCLNQLPPQQFPVQNCVATLENLQFQCEYYVRIEMDNGTSKKGKGAQRNVIARLTFATLPCEQTPTDVPLHCEQERKHEFLGAGNLLPAEAQPLGAPSTGKTSMATTTKKFTTSTAKTTKSTISSKSNSKNVENNEEWLPIEEANAIEEEETPRERGTRTKADKADTEKGHQRQLECFATSAETAECAWNWASKQEQKNNPLIGFRTVLSSTDFREPSKVTIVGPEQRRAHLAGLNPKAVYKFRLQAVTALGLGAELAEHFSTSQLAINTPTSKSEDRRNPADIDIQLGGVDFPEVVELPWGSSADLANTPFIGQFIQISISLLFLHLFLNFIF